MRLARLDLLRYGRFTNRSIELPRAERDIHVVFGPNEAGKTTSLTAIEDMLLGGRSAYWPSGRFVEWKDTEYGIEACWTGK